MTATTDYFQLTEGYLTLFQNSGTPFAELRDYYDAAVIWQEMPNLFAPTGRTNSLDGLAKSWQKGREAVPNQHYTIHQILVKDSSAVVELSWKATLTQALGDLAAGTTMQARVVLIIEFHNGKIIRQRDYICYYPLTDPAA